MRGVCAYRNLDRRMTHPVRSHPNDRVRLTLSAMGANPPKFFRWLHSPYHREYSHSLNEIGTWIFPVFPANKGSTILSTRRTPVGSVLSSISKGRNPMTLSVKDFKYWRILPIVAHKAVIPAREMEPEFFCRSRTHSWSGSQGIPVCHCRKSASTEWDSCFYRPTQIPDDCARSCSPRFLWKKACVCSVGATCRSRVTRSVSKRERPSRSCGRSSLHAMPWTRLSSNENCMWSASGLKRPW